MVSKMDPDCKNIQNLIIGIVARMTTTAIILISAIYIISSPAQAQIEKAGVPRSLDARTRLNRINDIISIPAPDLAALKLEDDIDASLEKSYRVGVCIPVSIDIQSCGEWIGLEDGSKLWTALLHCQGAIGIGLDFSSFYLPVGSDLFISNQDYSHVIGAFTSDNNLIDKSFSTRPVNGELLRIEYYQPRGFEELPELTVSNLVFIYRGSLPSGGKNLKNFGGSGSCEVNVNCTEGESWTDQSKGVVRILSRVKNQTFWCTGSLLNNTAFDFSPLVLTANHCSESMGRVSSVDDLNKWIFYFNYESTDCNDPLTEPVQKSMVGAQKLAASENPMQIGSDFFLVRLNQTIPPAYNPYYNGWNRADASSSEGVCIHHPEGDIKKISTYTSPLVSGTWQSIPGTHWIVQWSETAHGFGVTERGSSGSALFDKNGLIIGTLTGGESGCSNTSGTDYYGKIAFSWESNGVPDSMQLKPWLDPLNEGRLSMAGAFNDKQAVADFEADTTTIAIGDQVNFQDRSSGKPTTWNWTFEGGTPSSSTEQNPQGIKYLSFGKYSVRLEVTNEYGTDTLTRIDYIDVKAMIYPNPSPGQVTIFLPEKAAEPVIVELFNLEGQKLSELQWDESYRSSLNIDLHRYAAGFYFLKLRQGQEVQLNKIVLIKH